MNLFKLLIVKVKLTANALSVLILTSYLMVNVKSNTKLLRIVRPILRLNFQENVKNVRKNSKNLKLIQSATIIRKLKIVKFMKILTMLIELCSVRNVRVDLSGRAETNVQRYSVLMIN